MKIENPFHPGELAAQRLAGEATIAERNSAVIADAIIGGALPFVKQQKMVILASEGEGGKKWASPLFGSPGFVSPDDASTLRFRRDQLKRVEEDILWTNLFSGARIGMLAIELSTRRRLRVNGTISAMTNDEIVLKVNEAYPNCPKYIQRRVLTWKEDDPGFQQGVVSAGVTLSQEAAAILGSADTVFIASGHPERGLDVSHRGGHPGFLKLIGENLFRVPDYPGNSLFNTFGNLLVDANAGVTALDFVQGRILQMTGQAEIQWNQPDAEGATGGTGRFWTFSVERWQILPLPASAQWEYLDASPFNPGKQ